MKKIFGLFIALWAFGILLPENSSAQIDFGPGSANDIYADTSNPDFRTVIESSAKIWLVGIGGYLVYEGGQKLASVTVGPGLILITPSPEFAGGKRCFIQFKKDATFAVVSYEKQVGTCFEEIYELRITMEDIVNGEWRPFSPEDDSR